MAKASADEHASLTNYPDAVLSATDAASGATLTVQPDGRMVSATSRDGKTLWSIDVIDATGKPATGFPVVRLVSIPRPGTAMLVVGKSRTIEVDVATGQTKTLGED